MERRDFLKLTFGFVAGGAVLAASAQAAPLPPVSKASVPLATGDTVEPAVVSQDEVDHIKPEEVRWHHHGHWHRHWHRRWHRHWHRHWHHRHWRHHRHW